MQQQQERKTYTVKELSEVLGLGINQTYQALRDGQIPSRRFGRRFVIPRVAVERYLESTGLPAAVVDHRVVA